MILGWSTTNLIKVVQTVPVGFIRRSWSLEKGLKNEFFKTLKMLSETSRYIGFLFGISSRGLLSVQSCLNYVPKGHCLMLHFIGNISKSLGLILWEQSQLWFLSGLLPYLLMIQYMKSGGP